MGIEGRLGIGATGAREKEEESRAKDDCEAIWGIRHGGVGGGPGNMDAKIEDARIYATVLSQGEVKALRPDTLAIEALAKLATTWAAIKAR